jgi:hypothetical protein
MNTAAVRDRLRSRRGLRQALGVIWLIDAGLQMQPFMWTRQFGSGTIAAAGVGEPWVIGAPVRLAARLIADQPVAFNAAFVAVQLAVGAGLLLAKSPRWVRLSCLGSLGWALGVWVLGEGLGGVFTGQIGLDVGAPGAALLYAIITVAAWPSERPVGSWVLYAWAGVWVLGAVLQLLPAQRSAEGLGAQVGMAAMMSPSALARPEASAANWLGELPTAAAALITAGLVALQAWTGLGVLRGARQRAAALRAGAILALLFWVFCQGFGGISTAVATDPSSAPLLVLLAFSAAAVGSAAPVAAPSLRVSPSSSSLTGRNSRAPLPHA